MLLRYFLAEGVAAGHACHWAAQAGSPGDHLWLPQQSAPHKQQGPAPVNGSCQHQPHRAAITGGGSSPQHQQQDHLRIAWQYRRYMGGRADAAHAPHPAQQAAHARCPSRLQSCNAGCGLHVPRKLQPQPALDARSAAESDSGCQCGSGVDTHRHKGAVPAVTTASTPVASGWCHSFDLSAPQPAADLAPALVSLADSCCKRIMTMASNISSTVWHSL
jgi:PAXNEB protein